MSHCDRCDTVPKSEKVRVAITIPLSIARKMRVTSAREQVTVSEIAWSLFCGWLAENLVELDPTEVPRRATKGALKRWTRKGSR